MIGVRVRVLIAAAGMAGFAIGLAPVASAYEYGPVYATCTDAHNANVRDIPKGDPAYWPDGDRDKDGFACDSPGN